MTTAESIRTWLRGCPSIDAADRFNVDFMGKNSTEYALYSSPTPISYRKDILGGVYLSPTQELNYTFTARFPHSQEIQQALDNLGFFAGVTDWFLEKNQAHDFPEITEGTVVSIMPTLSPYLFSADAKSGQYQIQMKIQYRPKNKKGA